jgi:hypothetical protein
MKVRIICASPADGSLDKEDVCFTEDFESNPNDFVRFGLAVHTDKIVDIELPSAFPLEHTFSR